MPAALRTRAGRLLAVGALAAALVHGAAAIAAPSSPERVTFFGDSQAASVAYTPAARALLGEGIDLDLQVAVCRRLTQRSCPYDGEIPANVLDLVEDRGRPLGSTVVILVGYNEFETAFRDSVGDLMKALVARNVERVLWLTLFEQRGDWKRMNETVRDAAKSWPQLAVLDWNAEAAGKAWSHEGDIHLTWEGTMGLARFVHRALDERGLVQRAEPARPTLRVTVAGPGAVLVRGRRCRHVCLFTIRPEELVRLAARPVGTAVFSRWRGACAGRALRCALRPAGSVTVVARFRA
jgi:hypothetical protein